MNGSTGNVEITGNLNACTITGGTINVETDVTVGQKLQSADDGYLFPYVDGEIVGYSLDASSTVGSLVRVLLV